MNNNKITYIVFDTSILILAAERPINLFEEVNRLIPGNNKFIVLSSVLDELNRISLSSSIRESKLAKVALKIASKCEVINVNYSKTADESLLNFAKNNKGCVAIATNDSTLKRKLRSIGIPTIYVRDFDHLDLEGEII
ncbi:MAG: hypothetical protein NZ926_01275 [Candidatus Methanomethylicia archaeon]|nr:hypothetical protein [Candidatus Methanomethylicia archaeon]MCX8169062.1 hypothetical protein [Candidatus Methanomethylicia archaeon]MDW7988794.1 hypothetical protein [Nitrososphaerota archaeon]